MAWWRVIVVTTSLAKATGRQSMGGVFNYIQTLQVNKGYIITHPKASPRAYKVQKTGKSNEVLVVKQYFVPEI